MTNKQIKQNYIKIIILLLILIICGVRYCKEQGDLQTETGTAEVHIIDVGQGDSVLVKTDIGNLLIDAGTNDSENQLENYLISEGVTDFEYCIFTHPHEDHIGGADFIIDNFDVRNVIISPYTSTSYTFERLLDALERSDTNVIEALPDSKYSVGDLEIFIMGPSLIGDERDANNTSVITRLTYGENRFLFTGDAETIQENDIIDMYGIFELKCDFLKMGHHGSSTSSSESFIERVMPKYAAISCGENNSYGHPHREIIALLEKHGIEYRRTDRDGNIVYISDGKSIVIE